MKHRANIKKASEDKHTQVYKGKWKDVRRRAAGRFLQGSESREEVRLGPSGQEGTPGTPTQTHVYKQISMETMLYYTACEKMYNVSISCKGNKKMNPLYTLNENVSSTGQRRAIFVQLLTLVQYITTFHT